MVEAKKLHLQITAGPSYDTSTHQLVPVNQQKPVQIQSDNLDALVNVKIQNYRGLPSESPSTCTYFSEAAHKSDLYSISFSFTLKESIPGHELLFGNDFEHPIKDKLPPGFSTALRIVKWGIDPGLDGDVYADQPYLYGALASSINTLWVGDKKADDSKSTEPVFGALEEGGSEAGKEVRTAQKVPDAGAARMKFFLNEAHRKAWEFEAGREYRCDFYNPYLDFNDLALKLPGNFKLHLMSFWDGQPLRYTLKHRNQDASIDKVLFVVVITLIPEEDLKSAEEKIQQDKTLGHAASGAPTSEAKEPTHQDTASVSAGGATASGLGDLGLGHHTKDFAGVSGATAGGPAEDGPPVDDGGVD